MTEAAPEDTYDKKGRKIETMMQIRDILRSEPTQKKSIPKVCRDGELKGEIFPNEEIEEHPEEGIYYPNDVMNKDYYYQKLAQRLGYSKAYNFNPSSFDSYLDDTSLREYEQEGPELDKKKDRLNIRDSNLNAEMINFAKLDHAVEGQSKMR